MNGTRIMIVAGEKSWTLEVLHQACEMSRRYGIEVWLLKMIPISHPFLLETPAGMLDFSHEDEEDIEDFGATAEDYGVNLYVQLFQYFNYWSGVVDAADQLEVSAVIVEIPHPFIPYLQSFRRWRLHQQLARQHQLLFSLNEHSLSSVGKPAPTTQSELAQMFDEHKF